MDANLATIREAHPTHVTAEAGHGPALHPVDGIPGFKPSRAAAVHVATENKANPSQPMPAVLLMPGWQSMVGWKAPHASPPAPAAVKPVPPPPRPPPVAVHVAPAPPAPKPVVAAPPPPAVHIPDPPAAPKAATTAWQPSYSRVSIPADSIDAAPAAPSPPTAWVSRLSPTPETPRAVPPPAPVAPPKPAVATSWNPYKTAAHRMDVLGEEEKAAEPAPVVVHPPAPAADGHGSAPRMAPPPVTMGGGYPGNSNFARPRFVAAAARAVVAKLEPKKRHNLVRLDGTMTMEDALANGLGLDAAEMRALIRWAWEQGIVSF